MRGVARSWTVGLPRGHRESHARAVERLRLDLALRSRSGLAGYLVAMPGFHALKTRVASAMNRLEHRAAGSARTARVAATIRNHCNMLIGYHVTPDPDPRTNGEFLLLGALG